jgi:hypothetical protein
LPGILRLRVGRILEGSKRGCQGLLLLGVEGREEFGILVGSPEYAAMVSDVFAEAGLLTLLKHPNIGAFHGLTIDPSSGAPKYLIMERGYYTLRAYLRKVAAVDVEV